MFYHTHHDRVQPQLFLFAHVRISAGPSGTTSTVCSKWADRFRSQVRTVQRFGKTSTRCVPWLTIGSIANVIPGRRTGPWPGNP